MITMALEWVPDGTVRGTAVLLHDLMSFSATWWRIGPELARRGWHTYALDLAGHGGVPRLPRRLDPADLAQDVADRLTAIEGLRPPIDLLIGHAVGGVVALTLTELRRGFARALVLEDPPGTSARDRAGAARQILADAALARTDRERLLRRETTANPAWAPRDVEYAVAGVEQADAEWVAAGMRRPREWHLVDLVATATVPVLVLAAPDNPMLPPEDAPSALRGLDRDAVQRLLPPGHFAILSGGHCLHRDQPERWLARVSAFADVVLRTPLR